MKLRQIRRPRKKWWDAVRQDIAQDRTDREGNQWTTAANPCSTEK